LLSPSSLNYTTILVAKVLKYFCNLYANREKSNNQRVKEGKISPWGRMWNVDVPRSGFLDAAYNRARQHHPKGWYDTHKDRCCIEVKLLN